MVQRNGKKYKAVIEVIDDQDYILEVCRLLQILGHKPEWIVFNDGSFALIYYN